MRYMYYEWSGYTYPGGDGGVNVTSKVLYLLYDMIPNQWNLLDRNLLSDYTAFFGTPANASELVVIQISVLSHSSNGDPGDFWIDDIKIGSLDDPSPSAFNHIENHDFETGSFSPWENVGGTAYNQIVDTTVYNGTYSLFLDDHLSSAPYEPVTQTLAMNATLSDNLTLSAAIFPEKVGNTCGQAGVSQMAIYFQNKETGYNSHIDYEWSGYTYPGNDLGANISYARYLLFEWTPYEWNYLNRTVYDDYVAIFGVPSNVSHIEFYMVHLLSHSSNGNPGYFYADYFFLGNGYVDPIDNPITTTTTTTETSTTTTTETTSTTTTTTTSPTSTTTSTTTTSDTAATTTTSDTSTPGTTIIITNGTGDFGSWLGLVISGGSGGVIIIVIIVIILDRRGAGGGSTVPSGYEW